MTDEERVRDLENTVRRLGGVVAELERKVRVRENMLRSCIAFLAAIGAGAEIDPALYRIAVERMRLELDPQLGLAPSRLLR